MPGPNITGSLPWSAGGASLDFSGSPQGLQNSYASAYNSSLAMNQSNYANILKGFQDTMANQGAAQAGIQGGYDKLSGDVLGGITGAGRAAAQGITDRYKQLSSDQSQGLISRGLGNTTVANSVQRGLSLDEAKAQGGLAEQIAQLHAGYRANLGMAGLNYGNQANMQNTALANQQLGWMNSVNAGYPDANLYGRLAQQFGAAQQGNADRGLALDQLNRMQGAGAVGGLGRTGYTPGGSALTGRPSPGLFDGGGSYGSTLGGGANGFTASPGNYTGAGAAVAVGADGRPLGTGTADPGSYGDEEGQYDESGYGSPAGQDWMSAAYAGLWGGGYGRPPAGYGGQLADPDVGYGGGGLGGYYDPFTGQ